MIPALKCGNHNFHLKDREVSDMSAAAELIRTIRRGFTTAVVLAAGESHRMGKDKLFLELDGVPVLAMTLSALNGCADLDELIVVTREEAIDEVGALRERFALEKLTKVVIGGATRLESSLAGVAAADRRARMICIHDGARPFVTAKLVSETIDLAMIYGAATPALPMYTTVKVARKGAVLSTPDRETLYVVQTPQVFRTAIIKAALAKAAQEKIAYTDDCAAVEAIGGIPHIIAGDDENIKLTVPHDLIVARAILERRKGAAK